MNIELLTELVQAHGTAGHEGDLRAIVARELRGICELTVDTMGNLICHKRKEGAKRLMIAAHMDEIGFLVKFVDKDGFLRIQPLGGFDPRQLNSQRVQVRTAKGAIPGLLMYGTKPKHLLSEAEANAGQNLDSFFVDVGMTSEEAKKKVTIGDMVTLDKHAVQIGNMLSCKTMDDRVGVFVMIEAVKAAKKVEVDLYAVATVQEEIGLRGAAAAASGILPDIGIALDVTLANDIPGVPEQDHVTKPGAGTAIKLMDGSLICNPKVVDHFKKLAVKHKIKHQIEILPRGGTDAGAIQRLNGGVPSFTLSIPCRYVHTVNETVNLDDVKASIDLLAAYIQDAHKGDYTYKV
jgi:endoglucanase